MRQSHDCIFVQAPNRAPWVWVGAHALIAALRTFDTVENLVYLLISEGG